MLRRTLVALCLVIVTMTCAPVTAALADRPSVVGAGTTAFGGNAQHLSVHAFDTTGRAAFHFDSVVQKLNGQIEIDCVLVLGNQATLSGIVTHSNEPTLEGQAALFQVRDNGQGERDAMSPILFHTVGLGPDCLVPGEFTVFPVMGNFRVESG